MGTLKPPAREKLSVFLDGEEAPGLTFYGLISRYEWKGEDFPVSIWPDGSRAEAFKLYGDTWEIPCWDVALGAWLAGAPWREAVRATLQWFIAQGCVVGWMSAEGRPFCDPPGLFDPDCMSGGVLASLTPRGEFLCPIDPNEPIRAVDDVAMRELRLYTARLGDARA